MVIIFAIFLIKDSKNKNMEMQIIVIHDAQDDFDMKPDLTNFIQEKTSSPFYSEIVTSLINKV